MTDRVVARAALAITFVAQVADPAAAEPVNPPPTVAALVGTDLGRDASAGIQVEIHQVRLMMNVGWLPEPYAWGLKKFFEATHSNRDAVGDLLEDLTKNEFVAGANLTFRPFADRGFYFGVGYMLQIASKNGLVATAFEQGTGAQAPASDEDTLRTFNTDVHVHMIDGRVGWQWGLSRGFTVRADIGFMKILRTTTTLTPNFQPAMPAATRAFTDAASRVLEDAGTSIWAPAGSVFVGYIF